jgi:hypothetical protein
MEFIHTFSTLNFDLLMLGIENIGIRGKQIVKMIGKVPCIVLTTGLEMKEAILCHPIDTLLKPVNEKLLLNAFLKYDKQINSNILNRELMEFNTDRREGKILLKPKDFVYISKDEDDSRNKSVIMRNGDKHLFMNYSIPELEILARHLLRPNRNQLVCPEIITHHGYDHLYIRIPNNGNQPIMLTIGRDFAPRFKEGLEQLLFKA